MSYGFSHSTGATETEEVEVRVSEAAGQHTIVCYAVEDAVAAAGTFPPTYHQTAAGAIALWGKPLGAEKYEEVYESDGTTQVSFVPTTANQKSRVIEGAYTHFKAVPASLDTDCVTYLHVTSDSSR